MDNVLFIILAGGRGERLKPLTDNQPKPMVRFGSSGRIIDFTLYNCLTSGQGNVVVLTQYMSEILENHILHDWESAFNKQGRKLEVFSSRDSHKGYFSGTADAVYQVLLTRNNLPPRIMVLAGDHVYKMNYRHMIDFHRCHRGSSTVGTVKCNREQSHRFGIIKTGWGGIIDSFHEKPQSLKGIMPPERKPLASMGIYAFSTKPFIKYLENNQDQKSHDFGKDVIPQMVDAGDAWAYAFEKSNGKSAYWRDVGDLHSYWQTSMELLNGHGKDLQFAFIPGLKKQPFSAVNLLKNEICGPRKICNSLISETAFVAGASVEESVIGPDVCIEDGVVIRRSVILDKAVIREGTKLENVVVSPYADIEQNWMSEPDINFGTKIFEMAESRNHSLERMESVAI